MHQFIHPCCVTMCHSSLGFWRLPSISPPHPRWWTREPVWYVWLGSMRLCKDAPRFASWLPKKKQKIVRRIRRITSIQAGHGLRHCVITFEEMLAISVANLRCLLHCRTTACTRCSSRHATRHATRHTTRPSERGSVAVRAEISSG